MKFLVADDHPLVRRALALTVDKVSPGAQILEAVDLPSLLAEIDSHPDIDLILMDLFMPGSAGLEGLSRIRAVTGPVPVAVVSADETPDTALGALERGAAGYLPKSLPEDIMRAALSLILAGGTYVPPLVAVRPARTTDNPATEATGTVENATRADGPTPVFRGLTERQREVLDLVIEGMSNKEIAERLNLAEATVKVHITAILRTFGVNNRAKAISVARREAEAGRL